ncbi:MAG: CPBP family intramembrane metalloprotease [Erythrobacteraceae bacterium]|nr:CPBP family intramembrane metalloprotease [Erythrobacteraceae bacterium]|tara:strand:+ start:392 stop:1123 length:732 start_codon:yes stop_codon:yes gene_type:complete
MKQRSLSRNRWRRLSWLRFVLQLFTVALAYFAASIPPILLFGETNAGVLGSVVLSMLAALLVARLWLASDGSLRHAWSLRPPQNMPRTLALAAMGTGVITFLFAAGAVVIDALGLPPIDVSMVLDYVTQGPVSFMLWVVLVAWLAAGLGEELLYRGFLLDRLMRLRGMRGRRWPAAIIQAALFGLPHLYQGWGGVLVTASIGLFLAWLRFANRGNLWACILAHAAIDTIMLSLAYSQSLGWIS